MGILLLAWIAAAAVADPALQAEIDAIRAIDNHAHPLGMLPAGGKDPEFEIAESIPAVALPVRLRGDNPEYAEAWRALYGYEGGAGDAAGRAALLAAKDRVRSAKGDGYPAWVLDQLGTETMLVNRFTLGKGQSAPRFLWVPYANPLLFPLDNTREKKANEQREADFTADERAMKAFLASVGLTEPPADLDGYLGRVVVPLLERWKREGAVAVKFYAAYQRSLDFANAPEDVARRVYATHVRGGVPDAADYKALQDFLFHRIAREAGRAGLAVHVHVGIGAGGWFYLSGADPRLLDPVLNDPALRGTNIVLIHGGLPQAAATAFLLGKPNVYADFSAQGFLTPTRALADVLRAWLSFYPEKVLFGTDAYPLTTSVGWEEIAWVTTRNARRALGMALTQMMADGEITRARASELARMVLRENAIHLYGLAR